MSLFGEAFRKCSAYRSLVAARNHHETPTLMTGLSDIAKAQAIAALAEDPAQPSFPILVVVPSQHIAEQLCRDINTMAQTVLATIFPAKTWILTETDAADPTYEQRRIAALSSLEDENSDTSILIATAESIMQPTIAPAQLRANTLSFSPGDTVDLSEAAQQLIRSGYVRTDSVTGAGQFSIRGDIFDLFPLGRDTPVRMELWDDTMDTMTTFEIETQRRTDPIATVQIPPAREFLFSPETLSDTLRQHAHLLHGKNAVKQRETLFRDADAIDNGIFGAHLQKYAPFFWQDTPPTLFSYDFHTICICEAHDISRTQRTIGTQHRDDMALLLADGEICRGLDGYYLEPQKNLPPPATFQLFLNDFLPSGIQVSFQKIIHVEALQNSPWSGDMQELVEEGVAYLKQDYCVILCAGSASMLPTLQSDLRERAIPCQIATAESEIFPGIVFLVAGSISGGFSYPESKIACITQQEKAAAPILRRKSQPTDIVLADIVPGDFVVHETYGIGKFLGIRTVELDGVAKDYITIEYAGQENLYVPVSQLDRVTRYIGARDESNIKLSRLSSQEWAKTRGRVKKAVQDMAEELLAIYAKRENTKGFAFEPDDALQRDFESRFPYLETDDQLRCIAEIKSDMERPHPMDRLLCGDVGFGKTEVALRAAMKCVLSGKQCAILVPTTILAAQHYQTALQRFEGFPVNIVLLSRGKNTKAQKEVVAEINSGKADLIIGTHRMIQDDIHYHALGLAIIDEEQRFGVAQKEKFKKLFAGIDMLTLSATPIPRTLNMAMSGIRDMSRITTPPADRFPVQTYIMEYHEAVCIQALRHEIERGGQAYYLHNRVETIEITAARLRHALPNARIAVAHGKMSEAELSKIWRSLVERETDILVCTTIIETGVDVSNVNTLIVEDSDRLGLSQMYQLRGRVGRSNRRAYAYFTYRRDRSLRPEAAKRLEAIREFTQFGSGFQIALRDLEIRGAGNLLGGAQHGQMEAVGYEMYIQMLNEAVAEAKGEPVKAEPSCSIEIQVRAHIPETYIESLRQRLDMYRKIAAVHTETQQQDLIDELIDRYGEPPQEIVDLILVARFRHDAAALGITEITQHGNSIQFTTTSAAEYAMKLSWRYRGCIRVSQKDTPYFTLSWEKGAPLPLLRDVLRDLSTK